MRSPSAFVLAVLSCAAAALAQDEASSPELQRARRQLQQNTAEVERLVEMRLRHDLGLPVESDGSVFRATTAPTSEALDRARQELRDQDAANASLLERYNRLRAEAERLHAETEAKAQAARAAREFVVVPPANRIATGAGLGDPNVPFAVLSTPAAPIAESAGPSSVPQSAAAATVAIDLGLDPIRGRIHGSNDHQRVAHALFKAGQALMDRADAARALAQPEVARELDARAKERLERAVAELEPLLGEAEPPFAALFLLGRSREQLFRLAQRHEGLSLATSTRDFQRREQAVREPFLRITARDVQRTGARGEVELLGEWGRAAQAAMEHFRWMNLHAGYDGRVAIESLTWPGERP